MDEGTSRFISQYVDSEYLEGYTWKMTRKGLECIDCNEAADESLSELRDFDEVEISGKFDLRILQGNNYAVELNGPDQAKRQYSVRRSGETLVIDFERNEDINWDDFDLRRLPVEEMEIVVTMPSLERLEAMGLGSVQFEDLTGERLEVEVRGPVKVRGDMNVGEVTIRLTGKSEADLSGTAGSMTARVEFASRLRAYDLVADDAVVEVEGASTAKVNVKGTLEMEEGVASDIDYRGDPRIIRHD
jgi:hypothetical protein